MTKAAGEERQPYRRPRPADPPPPSAVNPSGDSDQLVADLKAERPEAYNRLYGLMADRLFRVAYRLLQDRQEAEDAVQQAFLELIRAGCPPGDRRGVEAWLYTSIRYSCLDGIRQRERRPATTMADPPEHQWLDEHWLGFDPELEAALTDLTPNQRLVLQLKHVEGLDGHRIAEITGSNRVAVYATAARAERRLGRLLAPHRPPSVSTAATASSEIAQAADGELRGEERGRDHE